MGAREAIYKEMLYSVGNFLAERGEHARHGKTVKTGKTQSMKQSTAAALVWFRRDLRSYDHAALHHALTQYRRVYCAFVFDTTILAPLPRCDRRVDFVLRSLQELQTDLRTMGGNLIVCHGDPRHEIPRLAAELGVSAVFVNRDYEPAAIARDAAVRHRLGKIECVDCKDQVISIVTR